MKRFVWSTAACTLVMCLFLAFGLTSCSTEAPVANDSPEIELKASPLDQVTEYVEAGNALEGIPMDDFTPRMIEGSANKGGDLCCMQCTGSLTFKSFAIFSLPGAPPAPWSLDLIATCSSDPNSILSPSAVTVGTYDFMQNPMGSTVTFDIYDEHFYWLVATTGTGTNGGVLNVNLSDPVGSHDLSLTHFNPFDPVLNITGVRLHCDNISYSECWPGGTRVCCL